MNSYMVKIGSLIDQILVNQNMKKMNKDITGTD